MIFIAENIDDCLHLFRYDSEEDIEKDCRETIFSNGGWEDVCLRVGMGNEFRYRPRLGPEIRYISRGNSAERVSA